MAMPRKLVWIETQSFLGFGCTDWVFKPTGALAGETLEEMKHAYEAERNKDFAAHTCSKFPRTSKPIRGA